MIDDLITQYLFHDKERKAATDACHKLADQIADELGRPDEGSKTHKTNAYSVTVKQPVNRKVDWDEFDKVPLEHPPKVMKPSLDLTGLRWIEQHDHDNYLRLAKTITATPGQVALTIKEI